MTMTVTSI